MLEPRLYAEWLHNEVFLPAIVVIGTETAKKRVRETNGLSLAELFGPFGGHFKRISVTYQGPERQMRLDGLRMRFVDAEAASQWSSTHAEQVSSWIVENAAPTSPIDPATALVPPSPWYEQWRQCMFWSLRWSEHEGLDQPVAALLVVSSKEANPLHCFEQLLHSSNMPPLCTQCVLDPLPARACVLLHDRLDPESPNPGELQERLDLVRAKFTPHLVTVVQINRGTGEALPQAPDLFRPFSASAYEPPPPPPPDGGAPASRPGPLGRNLAEEDLDALATAGFDIVTKTAVPWMQQQLQQLEAQISQSRKGLRNQLKYLWRKPRESSGGAGLGGAGAQAEKTSQDAHGIYPLQTTEGQMRLAGDLAFLLRDYETALGYYRNVVSDFKQDKSFKHSAGAYEMWGLCSYASGAPRSEWSRCMENAYNDYLQAAAGRHAMRVVALQQAMATDYREAALRLKKVNLDLADTGPRSPLVLEQAGQLYCQAGMMRTGSFHIILAGHSFNRLGFKRLALCNYQAVAERFNQQWFNISDHCYFAMARQSYVLKLYQESMAYFVKVMNSFPGKHASSQVAPDRQSIYLKEFFVVAQNWMENCYPGSRRKILNLQVPCIGQSVLVILPGEGAGSEPALDGEWSPTSPGAPPPPPPPPAAGGIAGAGALAAGLEERAPAASPAVEWERLGEQALPSLGQDDRLELQWRGQRSQRIFDSLRRVVAVGAEVRVEVELRNPMWVQLELVGAHLGGELEPLSLSKGEPARGGPTPSEASTDVGDAASACGDFISEPAGGEDADDALISFPSKNITLDPLETKLVQLVAVPRQDGLLRIRRVSWRLQGQVLCGRPLEVKGRRLRATVEQRASASGVYSVDRRLELRVRRTLPQLRARLEAWPRAEGGLLAGELHECGLVISGGGSGPGCADTVRIAVSHPSFVAFTWPEAVAAGYEGEVLVVRGLGAGEVRLALSLRADQVGRHCIRLCLLAEASDSGQGGPPSERRQWITLEEQLVVRPCLSCSVRPSPSHQEAGRLIFTCALENKSSDALEVERVRCVSGDQELGLEECVPGLGAHRVGPSQLLQLLFALRGDAPPLAAAASGARPAAARRRLLASSRQAAAAAAAAAPGAAAASRASSSPGGSEARAAEAPALVDLVFEWSAGSRRGEAFALGVPRERPSAAPCPLDLHLLAPESAALSRGLMVPVTLRVRNASAAGPVSFYYSADTVPEFAWLGCERSAVIKLQPFASHSATLYAHFASPGVFNLNRFRLFVVAVPPGVGAVPASEQAPLAFQFPFERLIHVKQPE